MQDSSPSYVATLSKTSKSFGGLNAIKDLDLAVAPGEVTALLGPNGAGKTTTVGLLTGRLTADAGEASLFGLTPSHPSARRRLGVMLQNAGLPETLTLAEQINLFAGYYNRPRGLSETIALAGLQGLEDRRCQQLSGGQQRRLQFALAICGRPDLLVLDEPTAGLDHDARRALWSVARDEADGGAAIVLTTHYLEEAEALADRIIVMDKGRIIADGSPAAIKARVAGSTIRCRTGLPLAQLAALPATRRADRAGGDTVLLSGDAVATIRALLSADLNLNALTVGAASLEEALIALSAAETKEAA
jgi:ABC-2 type transport system ATP-binding protein